MKNNLAIYIIVSLLIGLVGGFFIGKYYQQNQRRSFLNNQFGNGQMIDRNGQGGIGGTDKNIRGGFRPVNGEIILTDDKTITVKLTDGSSKIVLLTDKTEINKAEKVDTNELKEGVNIAVFGTENTDGSVSASNIQINPEYKMLNNNSN